MTHSPPPPIYIKSQVSPLLPNVMTPCYVLLKGRQQSKSYSTQHYSIFSSFRMCYQKSYNNEFTKHRWLTVNHNKQWTTIISTIKDNWTQQLQQSHCGNNVINIIQHPQTMNLKPSVYLSIQRVKQFVKTGSFPNFWLV